MCGIAGIRTTDGRDRGGLRRQVRRITCTLSHPGPDGDGIWVSEDGIAAFGQRRLAIIVVSPTGAQPMMSGDGRFVVTYNGEIYNYREIKSELKSLGARFRGTSDTEVIVESCT